jgi:hypothetical protein
MCWHYKHAEARLPGQGILLRLDVLCFQSMGEVYPKSVIYPSRLKIASPVVTKGKHGSN